VIGIAVVFPVLLLALFMLFAPWGAYQGGQLHAELLDLLIQEVRLRRQDQTEDLSEKTLGRLDETIRIYRDSIADAQGENLPAFDAAVAAFSGDAVDPAFLAQRRSDFQGLALERLRKRCQRTLLATDIIKRWRYWVMFEKARLCRLAIEDVGFKAFQYFLRKAAQRVTNAGVLGLVGGVLIWWLLTANPGKKPQFLIYLGNSTALGAFIGLAYTVTASTARAWRQHVAVLPVGEPERRRLSWVIALVLLFSLGPVLYFDLIRKFVIWLAALIPPLWNSQDVISFLVPLYIVAAVGIFMLQIWGALKNWRSSALLTFPQRLDELSFAMLGITLLGTFAVLVGFRLVGGGNVEERFLQWWLFLALAGFLCAGGVAVMAGLARFHERRSRWRRFREIGLQPKRFWPIWLIGTIWFVGTQVALITTALLIAVLNPELTKQNEIPSWVTVTIACVMALCAIGATIHIVIARRRRKREDQRLVKEYRRRLWERGS
jgi:hypothetical protein